ncbi:hypothetical protein AB0B45_13825 [Nonomuraea sp. NPDC049152]|uniref:hypothetical protein n=1 Tax=Nonomuraea sp. NPDC049152 TaxID=3154350 RepID=UPI0034094F86
MSSTKPCEIAVQWSVDGTVWTEAPDSRFLRIKRRGNGSDPTGLVSFELPGFVWMLRKIVLYPGTAPLVDGKRPFLAATAGAIQQTFIAEAKGRGSVPSLNWDFDPDTDSAGAAWDKVLTIYYQPGMDALTALQNLAEQGVCDYRVSGRTVQVFNADTTMERDLASGAAPVDLRYGRDIAEAPDDGTLEDAQLLLAHLYARGTDGQTSLGAGSDFAEPLDALDQPGRASGDSASCARSSYAPLPTLAGVCSRCLARQCSAHSRSPWPTRPVSTRG